MHSRQIRGVNEFLFNQVIGFRCICERRGFWTIENQNCNLEVMVHSKSLNESIQTPKKMDLLSQYDVSVAFNVSDIYLFESNPFEEKMIDMDQPSMTKDPLKVPITRLKANKLNEALTMVVQSIWVKTDFNEASIHIEQPIINLIHVQ